MDAGSGSLLGAVDLQDLDAEQGPQMGFWVAPGARRRGVARPSVRRLAQWAFDDLGLPRIRWSGYQGNAGSRRVAESVGFVMEGSSRLALQQRGVRRDAWLGSMLPEDLARVEVGHRTVGGLLGGWPKEPVQLRSDRLLLRPSREDDAPALLAYAQDPLAGIWDPEETPDLDAARERARRRADWSSGDVAVWVITDPDDTAIWGGIQLFDVYAHSLCAVTGYGLMPEARGNGYATRGASNCHRVGLRRNGSSPHHTDARGRQHGIVRGGDSFGLSAGGTHATVTPLRRR